MTVLVAMDGSDPAQGALKLAIAENPVADILVLHVIDPPGTAPDDETPETMDWQQLVAEGEEQATRVFDEADTVADDLGGTIATDTVVGKPAKAIIAYADENDVDEIVIGSHGREGVSRVLLGSVAERVARRASVPVTIVPNQE